MLPTRQIQKKNKQTVFTTGCIYKYLKNKITTIESVLVNTVLK